MLEKVCKKFIYPTFCYFVVVVLPRRKRGADNITVFVGEKRRGVSHSACEKVNIPCREAKNVHQIYFALGIENGMYNSPSESPTLRNAQKSRKKSKQSNSKGNILYKNLWIVDRVGGSQAVRKNKASAVFLTPSHPLHIVQSK